MNATPRPDPGPGPGVEEPHQVAEVFELFENGRSRGLFASVTGAQEHAEATLTGYQHLLATLTPQEREDTEPVVEHLTWNLEQSTFGPGRRAHGPLRPTARYAVTGVFDVRARPVHP